MSSACFSTISVASFCISDEASELGLTEFEHAFYTAVANNKSAKELMQHDKLRELAVVLTERVKQNALL
jgi:type I restriction enzyme R subunit